MTKKFITKNAFLSEILTKNLVTFKRCNRVKDEKFYYYRGSPKIHQKSSFGGRVHKKTIYRGKLPKRRGANKQTKLFSPLNYLQITYYIPLLNLTIIILLDVLIKNIWVLS